ncbi:hypothetical protein ABPG74_017912 [Tetrahymena malaccensis]
MLFQILYLYTLLIALIAQNDKQNNFHSNQNPLKNENLNNEKIQQPVIGILTLPSGFQKYDHSSFSYIYASYVQYFQQTGALIIPLKYTSSLKFLKNKMDQINGLVIPGGGANLMYRNNESGDKEFTKFAEVGEFLISVAKQLNNEGKYFPVWGTCLGFELLVLSFTKTEIRDQFQGENHLGGFFLSQNNTQKSRLFNNISQQLKQQIKHSQQVFYFNHKYGFKVNKFIGNGVLKNQFIPLAYSLDLSGKKFVAIAEAKQYPFYGIQFHPEKLQFEWSQQSTDQQSQMNEISIVKYFSEFFYQECLKNNSNFKNKQSLNRLLIQNYKVIYTKGQEFGFYIFNNKGKDTFKIKIMCAFAYILGYRQKEQENSQGYKSTTSKQYNRINEDHCDEEALVERTPQPKPAEEVNSEKDTLIKDQQKEIDRLMRQLTDFKKREQKNVAEIQYLKTKITSSTVGTSSNPSNNQTSDLITDKGFTDLLDEASQNLKDNDDIDEDELSKQIDQSLL